MGDTEIGWETPIPTDSPEDTPKRRWDTRDLRGRHRDGTGDTDTD